MTRERLYLFDTTLRDGQQTPGVDFSLEDKLVVAEMLDELGIDYIEGGYPGANPVDTALFAEPRPIKATFTAFGMTKRSGRSLANDPGIKQVLEASADAVCFVAKTSDFHVRVALGISNEENLEAIQASVQAARAAGKEALVDCEHFFDGFKANPDYALACARTAFEAGRAGSCYATPMAAASPRRSMPSSAPSPSRCRGRISAFMPTTTPSRRLPTRWRRCWPAPARSRARSTASASAAAMPISCRSSRRWR